jgi:hypothetical protein
MVVPWYIIAIFFGAFAIRALFFFLFAWVFTGIIYWFLPAHAQDKVDSFLKTIKHKTRLG